MILYFLSIIIFSISYLFKGGQFNNVLNKLPFALSGKLIAALIIFIFCSAVTSDWVHGLIFCAAWVLAVSPSMGEEAGAIGRWGHWWGDYRDAVYSATYPAWTKKSGMPVFSRSYGVLKGVQRGAWMGAVFTVAGATTLSIPIMALGFPLAHFIGQELYFRIHKKDDWKYAEILVGALLGLCYVLSKGF